MSRAIIDLTGQRFGRLLVLSMEFVAETSVKLCICRCDCGQEKKIRASNLRSGTTASCGCLNRENASRRLVDRQSTHGATRTPTYVVWRGMIDRCRNPANKNYRYYGGRGIRVCERWVGSFEAFQSDMGCRPVAMTLDRVNNDGDYEPGNCRWATSKQQARNTSRNVLVEVRGETLCLKDWADRLSIYPELLASRHRRKGIPYAVMIESYLEAGGGA